MTLLDEAEVLSAGGADVGDAATTRPLEAALVSIGSGADDVRPPLLLGVLASCAAAPDVAAALGVAVRAALPLLLFFVALPLLFAAVLLELESVLWSSSSSVS